MSPTCTAPTTKSQPSPAQRQTKPDGSPYIFSLDADPKSLCPVVRTYLSIVGWDDTPSTEVVTDVRMQRGMDVLRAARRDNRGLFYDGFDDEAIAARPRYPYLPGGPPADVFCLLDDILASDIPYGEAGPYTRNYLSLTNLVLAMPDVDITPNDPLFPHAVGWLYSVHTPVCVLATVPRLDDEFDLIAYSDDDIYEEVRSRMSRTISRRRK